MPARDRAQAGDVDLDVEVARVREQRAVLHLLEVFATDHVAVAGRGAEDVADRRGALHRQHLEALHDRLERAQRVDLADDDARAHAARAQREPLPAPAVARDHEDAPGEQHVRRAEDAVDRRLARAVAVVEEVLRARLVDGDHREAEHAVALHRAQADARPVVVSSVAAMTSPSCSRRCVCSTPITSAPSSIVICGRWSTAA